MSRTKNYKISMKRFLLLAVAMFAMATANTLSAQGLLDALKGAATGLIDQATGGKATELLLPGTWSYNAPAMRLKGSDALSEALANAAVTGLEEKLATAYNYVGIKPGTCSFKFDTDDRFTMTTSKRSYSGSYTYDAQTHRLELTFDTTLIKLGSMTGYAYIDGEALDLVFDCSKFFNFLTKIGAQLSSTSSLTKMLEKYDGMMIGFALQRSK